MRFYIIDDDQAILYVLRNIIEQNFNDEVVGINSNAPAALKELAIHDVDIVLVDLLMPELSGIELVKQVKAIKPASRFIMISKVQDSELRAKAYQAGIEFFINKPINLIEVRTVIEKVEHSIQMEKQLSSISAMVNNFNQDTIQAKPLPNDQVERTLRYLGMMTEKGTDDIRLVASQMLKQNCDYRNFNLSQALHISQHDRHVMEQRIRRAIKVGLTNLANQLIDNPYDDQLTDLANQLFGYENIRNEVLFRQGKRNSGGRITIQRFMDGLVNSN